MTPADGPAGGPKSVGDGLERSDQNGVVWLELSRPQSRNALTTALLLSLREQLTLIGDDPEARVLVISGTGAAFCAGADITEFAPGSPPRLSLARVRLVSEVLTRIRALEQPTIAAVTGPAIGAGWGLSLACDLCFCAADATFRLPEISNGFRLPGVIVHRLINVVGPVRAAEIALGGEKFDAQQALAWGWATRVFDDEETLRARTEELAVHLAARPRRSLATATAPLRHDTNPELTPPSDYGWPEE
ncbi:enoyl-CoA hydratase/isomerase family protein [Rathayibacter soli]|uniref:enoyl-CoA hydratase/isomerase family protein n=1 Tax=Rathayibacter soli TaxID=3144168 RepID=UPI0027E4D67F|nr:enoyl-CoA hydratase/isomerase family protein [Glaciibacter superstes]